MRFIWRLVLGAWGFCGWAAAEGPYIVHVSDTAPDYTMAICGGGFDPAAVQVVVHVPGTVVKQRDELPKRVADLARQYDGKPTPAPAEPPKTQTHVIKPLHVTPRTVFAKLPPAHPYPPGYVAIVWLKDGGRLSNPFVVNQPRAWFLLKPTSRPGELNRLGGANLVGDRYVPRYVFLRLKGGPPVQLPQVARHHEDGVSENFCIQFRVPPDLAPGDYEVFAHSNSGNEYGFTQPLPLKVTTEPSFPEKLYVATEHGVKGDSFTDNHDALQQVIDRAGEDGGGIVFLPPGAYRVDDTLQMRAHVILRGAGRDCTTLFFGGAPHQKKRFYWFISAREVHHTGIEDVTIRLSPPMTLAVSYYDRGQPSYDTHLLRCRFVDGSVAVNYNIRMEIGHCLFEGGRFHAHTLRQAWIHDNDLTVGRLQGNAFVLWGAENCTLEHNRVHGSNRGFVWQIHGLLGHYHNLIDANVVESARFGGNAGETYLFEGAGFQWFGKPDEVRPDGFTARGVGWKPDALKNSFAVVTHGRGLGQYVRIAANTDSQVTLVEPWRVRPTGDVRVSVLRGVVENAITNNRHVDCDNSMMFYGAGILNNRICRNRAENTLGISVWSMGEAEKGVLAPDYFNVFDGNVLEDGGSFWLTRLGDIKQGVGVRNLNNVFRDHFVADVRRKRENQYTNVWEQTKHGMYRPIQSAFWLDIGRSYESDRTQTPIWLDTLIERNYITRCDWGIELRKIAGGALLHANTFFDVKLPIIDQGAGNVAIGNRIEQPVFENPPPWAELDRATESKERAK
ncbi:MAG: hypothetical protein FJ279_17375 [Planctomycetes bacterium]|nr:hypothetical protein [Planctomycetota bacterium]